MDLKGKTALVTGAARRVGRSIALDLARRGASIVLHYHRSKTDAEAVAAEITALGVRCRTLSADLSSASEAERLACEAGPVDVLVNSASVYKITPLDTVSEHLYDFFLDANLKGPFFLAKEIGLAMQAGRGGAIVNIADWSGFRPYKRFAPYCISKGGVLTMTKALARDLAPNVRVNAVAPGPVLPPSDMDEAERQAIAKTTAVGRWGSPEDVATAVAFLAQNEFMNGTVLVVDGGRSIV